jgi:transcriptional regulator with XRE-family HTH domain
MASDITSALPPRMKHADMNAAMEPTTKKDVAARLRHSRVGLKLKQVKICELAEIEPGAWNNYEKARSRIGLDPATRLCQVTGLTLDWIFRGRLDSLPHALALAIAKAITEGNGDAKNGRRGPRRKRAAKKL